MAVVLILLGLVLLVIGAIGWIVKVTWLRPDRVKPTYQIVGAVYEDREGDEWVVTGPGVLALVVDPHGTSARPAKTVEEHWGPLVYVHHEAGERP